MAESKRRDAATAALGLTGVGSAGALRHSGLEAAYGGGKRPPLLQEAKFLRRKVPGRGRYLTGAGIGLVAVPPAAVGTARLLGQKSTTSKRDDRHKTFLEEGLTGVKQSISERNKTLAEKPPAKLMAANYLGGAAIGSATGGLVHRSLSRTRFPGAGRSALAAMAGVAAGAATLPAQSKLIERASHGRYVATPTGVRRKKTKAVRPSQVATVVEGRPGRSNLHPHALREQMGPVSKALRVKVVHDSPLPKTRLTLSARKTRQYNYPPGYRQGYSSPGERLLVRETPRIDRKPVKQAEIRAAYKEAGFTNSAGKPRKLHREELQSAQDSTGPASFAAGLGGLGTRGRFSRVERPRVQKSLVSKGPLNTAGAHVGAHWTVNLLRAADKVDVPDRRVVPRTRRGKLVYTGRTKASNAVRQAAFDVGSINDKDAMVRNTAHGHPLFGKRDGYYGEHLSRGQKRARVMAANTAPVVGDFAAAAAAGSMAPPELRRKTATWQFGSSQGGQAAGTAAGAYGLVRAAKHPAVRAKVERANDAIDAGTNAVRSSLGMRPQTGPGRLMRMAESPKTPKVVRGALRPLAKNPKVAAVGALAGGMAGTQAGGFLGYGHALNLERERNARLKGANSAARKGVAKRQGTPLTPEEHRRQARRKKIAAGVATFTGTTGVSALGALGASKLARARGAVKLADQLKAAQTPLLTAGAGVGGLGSFNFATMQRKEAKAEQNQIKKALVRFPKVPPTPRLRAPAMRRGYLRQVRAPGGPIRTSTVRGGLG